MSRVDRARALLVVIVAVVVAALAVSGAVVPDARGRATPPSAAEASAPGAGGVVCAWGETADGGTVDLVAAAPAGSSLAARTTVVVLGDRPSRLAPPALGPGSIVGLELDVAPGGLVWTGWAGSPVVVWREWRRPAAPGVPRGRTAAPCIAADAPAAYLLGLRTDGGNEGRVRLANPFPFDATVAFTVFTGAGVETPLVLRNVSVPAGGTADVRLNDHVPERQDVAVLVDVLAGRVAVEGLQLAVAGVGGVDGLAIVPSVPAASSEWTLPWVPGDADAIVWVLNPTARDVDVELTIHTPDGPALPPELDVVTIGAGRLVGIGSGDLVPSGLPAVGVSLRSDTGAVVVGGGLRVDPGDPSASGVAALPALAAPDRGWLVAGLAGTDRVTRLQLVNVDARELDVTLVLRTGDGEAPTRTLAPIRLPAGGQRSVPLPLLAGRPWAVEVRADGELVVAREGSGEDAGQPVVAPGVPASTWGPSPSARAGLRRDGWTREPALRG